MAKKLRPLTKKPQKKQKQKAKIKSLATVVANTKDYKCLKTLATKK